MRRARPLNRFHLDHDRANPETREFRHGSVVAHEAVVKRPPEDQLELKSQLRRALVEAFAGVAATASLTGDTRRVRAQTTRAFASEAAALLDTLVVLDFVKRYDITPAVDLLGRLCAMLTRLGTHTSRAL